MLPIYIPSRSTYTTLRFPKQHQNQSKHIIHPSCNIDSDAPHAHQTTAATARKISAANEEITVAQRSAPIAMGARMRARDARRAIAGDDRGA